MLPNSSLSTQNIRLIENEILLLCRHCKTYDELVSAGSMVWDWAASSLNSTVDELRGEVETHAMDEKFPTQFEEEKDHLLKIPVILLEHFHQT